MQLHITGQHLHWQAAYLLHPSHIYVCSSVSVPSAKGDLPGNSSAFIFNYDDTIIELKFLTNSYCLHLLLLTTRANQCFELLTE